MTSGNFVLSKILLALGLSALLSGCATIKGWVGLGDSKEKAAAATKTIVDTPVRFSDNNNVPATSAREYKRMTRQRMEEESQVNSQAGSMWVMEGQGAYLFAQNKTRREGDLLNVKIEGAAQQQIDTKVAVIKKLLKQLEDEEKKAKDREEAEKLKLAQAENGGTDRSPASTTAAAPPPPPPPPAPEKKSEEKDEQVKIDSVPTRLVEKQPDGNYRLKGQQPFMIGKREYKVIVTGIIRPEDFNDEGVSSAKLLDPQFDVVSLRRKE